LSIGGIATRAGGFFRSVFVLGIVYSWAQNAL